MQHVDLVSTVAGHAYLAEAQGLTHNGRALPRDLLEALLGGGQDPDWALRRARSLGIRLAENYVVFSIRPQEVPVGKNDVHSIIGAARNCLQPPSGQLLTFHPPIAARGNWHCPFLGLQNYPVQPLAGSFGHAAYPK